jgi:serine/threonine protein kinase/tetratricopeptide (TPR) repeat protein
MMPYQADQLQSDLNDLLEAYEHARAVEGDVDLQACLPSASHPLYREARSELVRLDLEYSWQNRRPKPLAAYVALFPDLFDDQHTAHDIAFEEYRLRALAGENPSAAEYTRLYGVDTALWPGSDHGMADLPKTILAHRPRVDDKDEDTLINRVKTPPLEWSVFEKARGADASQSLSGEMAQALLKQNEPFSSAEASFLLAQALTSLPGVGAQFLNFQLIAELGRGGFGCVYLAREGGLANRLVALKITVDLQGEEQKLAQLQHTNVVPIYSAPKTEALHAVCMPYFGPTTLADVIRYCHAQPTMPTSGACLVEALRRRLDDFQMQTGATPNRAADSPPSAAATPVLKLFEESTFVNAVLWLAERVTEGLLHAHQHGILHGDLKPANILLTDEGQPMLLDFNLATDIKVRAALGELRIGGTLPYMAPEHLDALRGGDRRKVDARSDIYGLGVILFELLTGKQPFESRRGPLAETLLPMMAERLQVPPRLRKYNPAISPAVESIVRHCLQPDPAQRYQTAQELLDDLQRHAHDLPVRHAPEPALTERAGKWMRRHPHLTAPTNVIAALVFIWAALLAPTAFKAWEDWQSDRQHLAHAKTQFNQAKKDNEDTHKKLLFADERARNAEARIKALDQFRQFHNSAPLARDLTDSVTLMRLQPESWLVEHMNAEKLSDAGRRLLAVYRVRDDADWRNDANVALLSHAEKETLHADVASHLYALAELEHLRAERLSKVGRVEMKVSPCLATAVALQLIDALPRIHVDEAWRLNTEAQKCFPPDAAPRALKIQQTSLIRLGGNSMQAERLMKDAEKSTLRTDVDDAYWTAAAWAAQTKTQDASLLLAEVTRHTPDHFGAWRVRALCHQAAGEVRRAASCWDTCAALKPGDEWTSYCRGQVHLQLRRWSEAQKDFDAFLQKRPDFRSAYLGRAAAWEGQQNYAAAISDLTKAIDLGPAAPELLFLRVELMEKNKDATGAERDRIRLLSTEPEQLDGWVYRGMLKARKDPEAALADFERALATDPNNVAALYQKGMLLIDKLGRPVEGIGALNRLLIADPNHADARLKRGLVYASAGLRDKAVADAIRALERDVTPARCYQAACIYAFTSKEELADRTRVLEMLEFALRNGYANDQVQTDVNLPLAHIPEAAELIRAAPLLGPARKTPKN